MSLRHFAAFLLLMGVQTAPSEAASPSFACAGATQADLVAICNNDRLAQTDLMTTEMFEKARQVDRQAALLVARSFLKDRANCGGDENCILVTQTLALAAFGEITRDIAQPSAAPLGKAEYVKDGFLIRQYPDGSGSVAIGEEYDAHRWSYNCRIDKMTDKRACYISATLGGPFISYSSGRYPTFVCILGHDFPGRTGMIRVDANAPIETSSEGCVPASDILEQMKNGQNFITRSYRWPRDWSVDSETSLSGLSLVLEVVDGLLASGK